MKKARPALAAVAAGAIVLTPFVALPATAADPADLSLTVLGTTDVHGRLYNWDYFTDAPYPQGSTKEAGLSRVATIVDDVRAAKGADSVLVVDNGDAIQGTPLTYLAARQPALLGGGTHPFAEAFNTIGYDVQNLGNHEFNYGLDLLDAYEGALNAPLLGANVFAAGTDTPAFAPYELIDRTIDGHDVRIGVIGVVTPGVRVWDKPIVEGVLDFGDAVLAVQKYVPEVKAAGADVVVVLAHTGLDAAGSVWDAAELQENVAETIATHVDDIDLVVGGHSHVDIPSRVFHAPDGDPVLFTQPVFWAQSVSEVTLPLVETAPGAYAVAWPGTDEEIGALAKRIASESVEDAASFTGHAALTAAHTATVGYVNTVVATSAEELSAATSMYEDTPILDFIGSIEQAAVRDALRGTPYEGLPVVAQASPFSRTALFPEGEVTVKDIAGLYTFDNTLLGVELTGAQLKDYLEWSARYFRQVEPGAVFDPATDLNALYPGATRGIPDYSYDVLTGVDYVIDVSKPVGERIVSLTMPGGAPVAPGDRLVLAVNNYRQSGGSGYPHVAAAPVVYDGQREIRQLLIDDAQESGTIDAAQFHTENWTLTTGTAPTPTVAPTAAPTATPTATVAPTATPTATPSPTPGALPSTGGELPLVPFVLAAGLLAAGGLLLVRRRAAR